MGPGRNAHAEGCVTREVVVYPALCSGGLSDRDRAAPQDAQHAQVRIARERINLAVGCGKGATAGTELEPPQWSEAAVGANFEAQQVRSVVFRRRCRRSDLKHVEAPVQV